MSFESGLEEDSGGTRIKVLSSLAGFASSSFGFLDLLYLYSSLHGHHL